jgi:hypothetical protein
VRLDYHPEREVFVRSFPGLEFINDKSAAEFWKEVSGKKLEPRTLRGRPSHALGSSS